MRSLAPLPGFHTTNWHGLWGPKGTPKDAIAALNATVVAALADPAVRSRLGNLGLDITLPAEQTPAALAAHQKAEAEKWWPIIRAANIKAE
jgi:tripartite-type tricarboxylate transporter receptor subunit TctC